MEAKRGSQAKYYRQEYNSNNIHEQDLYQTSEHQNDRSDLNEPEEPKQPSLYLSSFASKSPKSQENVDSPENRSNFAQFSPADARLAKARSMAAQNRLRPETGDSAQQPPAKTNRVFEKLGTIPEDIDQEDSRVRYT